MKMKIAYFNGVLKREDGVGVVLTNLTRESAKRGTKNLVITGLVDDPKMVEGKILELPSMPLPFYKEYKIPLPGSKELEKKLDAFLPDIIHIHSPDPVAWTLVKYAKKKHIPIVATHHTDFARYLSYFHIGYLESVAWGLLKQFYVKMAAVTTPSAETAKDLLHHGVKNVRVIEWGVDPLRFAPSFRSGQWRRELLGEKKKFVVLCICRLIWYKDLRVLADAYKLLQKNRDDFEMVVAGEGPARTELEGLMPGAHFLGHIEGAELSKVFASADVLLFPSCTETFGNVTLEAMASGTVPVVANAGGSKSLVREGVTGLHAEPGNPEDFCRKVEFLLDNQTARERMQSAGLAFAAEHSWEAVSDEFLELYKKCIKKSSKK